MAHYPKPFFRPARGVWYVQIDGKQINLGPGETEAFKAYHRLVQERSEFKPATVESNSQQLVVVIVDDFLSWCEKNRAAATYGWYRERLNSFCQSIPAKLTVEKFRPHHVQAWTTKQVSPQARGGI